MILPVDTNDTLTMEVMLNSGVGKLGASLTTSHDTGKIDILKISQAMAVR